MKEDIVNQLREHEEKRECGGGVWWENPAVCEEAAKEIERLRAKLASAKEVIAPFSELGKGIVDKYGWTSGHGNERLSTAITPSHLRAAAEWMETER